MRAFVHGAVWVILANTGISWGSHDTCELHADGVQNENNQYAAQKDKFCDLLTEPVTNIFMPLLTSATCLNSGQQNQEDNLPEDKHHYYAPQYEIHRAHKHFSTTEIINPTSKSDEQHNHLVCNDLASTATDAPKAHKSSNKPG